MPNTAEKIPENVKEAIRLITEQNWRTKGAARVTGTTVEEIDKWLRILAQNKEVDTDE